MAPGQPYCRCQPGEQHEHDRQRHDYLNQPAERTLPRTAIRERRHAVIANGVSVAVAAL
jgi:hypothetical protein